MACGSARMLADLIDGRRPDVDPTRTHPHLLAGTQAFRSQIDEMA
jgi:glycine/D-amino acid oxidase-like deaminating enzyme